MVPSSLFQTGTAFFPGSSLTGNGLIVSDGELWLRQRRLCNPAFRKCVVDTYAQVMDMSFFYSNLQNLVLWKFYILASPWFQSMVDLTSKFVKEKWQKRCIRDVYGDFNNLTMQIVTKTLFGGTSGMYTFDEVGQAITTAFKSFTKRGTSMFIGWFPSSKPNVIINVQFPLIIKSI